MKDADLNYVDIALGILCGVIITGLLICAHIYSETKPVANAENAEVEQAPKASVQSCKALYDKDGRLLWISSEAQGHTVPPIIFTASSAFYCIY